MTDAIVIKDVEHIYNKGTENEVHALKGINLRIGRNESVAIIGQNGSGKTTLVKHFNGLLRPTKGRIEVLGEDVKNKTVDEMSKTVGFAFQNPDDQLFKSSVKDELYFGPNNIGLSDEKTEEMTKIAAEMTGLSNMLDSHPYDLVYSTRKLLAIATVISMDPDFIILDEPTTGQDYSGINQMGNMISELRKRGKTIITITHDMDFVSQYFDRVIVLCQGEVLLDGPTGEVLCQTEILEKSRVKPPYLTLLGQEFDFESPIYSVDSFYENIQKSISK